MAVLSLPVRLTLHNPCNWNRVVKKYLTATINNDDDDDVTRHFGKVFYLLDPACNVILITDMTHNIMWMTDANVQEYFN